MKSISYEGYTVREDGKVIGKFGKEIGKTNSNGYTYITINGKQMLRHRLVWIAFVGKIPDGFEIDHIIPLSKGGTDALSNLRLLTHKENCNNLESKKTYSLSNKGKATEKLRKAASQAMKQYHQMLNHRSYTEEEKSKRISEYQRRYYLENKEKIAERQKRYYQEHKEKIKENKKAI